MKKTSSCSKSQATIKIENLGKLIIASLFFLLSTQLLNAQEMDKEFPNYFAMDQNFEIDPLMCYGLEPRYYVDSKISARSALLSRVMRQLIEGISVPYVDDQGKLQNDYFFNYLYTRAQNFVREKKIDSHLRIYVYGGVIRSLLSYIYSLMHDCYKGAQKCGEGPLPSPENFLRKLSKDYNPVTNMHILGVGSDLDILYRFDDHTLTNSNTAVNALVGYLFDTINSAETQANLRNFKSTLKNSLFPPADVKHLDTQLERTLEQGGSLLDTLSLDLYSGELIGPETLDDPKYKKPLFASVFHRFICGGYDYISPESGQPPPKDKQTIRGLRPLVQLPFLKIRDPKVINKELDEILERKHLSRDALAQVDKLYRNSLFSGANNRFMRESPDLPGGKFYQLGKTPVYQKWAYLESQKPLPPWLSSELVSIEDFEANHMHEDPTDQKYYLFHGTSVEASVLIMRSGFWSSLPRGQGLAALGPGVYTTKDSSVAKQYYKDDQFGSGVAFRLKLKENPRIRIIDWEVSGQRIKTQLQKSLSGFNLSKFTDDDASLMLLRAIAIKQGIISTDDPLKKIWQNPQSLDKDVLFHFLRILYDIDIIINTFPLIQNINVIELGDPIRDILQGIELPELTEVKKNPNDALKKFYRFKSFYPIARVHGVSTPFDEKKYLDLFYAERDKLEMGNKKNLYEMIFSYEFSSDEKLARVYEILAAERQDPVFSDSIHKVLSQTVSAGMANPSSRVALRVLLRAKDIYVSHTELNITRQVLEDAIEVVAARGLQLADIAPFFDAAQRSKIGLFQKSLKTAVQIFINNWPNDDVDLLLKVTEKYSMEQAIAKVISQTMSAGMADPSSTEALTMLEKAQAIYSKYTELKITKQLLEDAIQFVAVHSMRLEDIKPLFEAAQRSKISLFSFDKSLKTAVQILIEVPDEDIIPRYLLEVASSRDALVLDVLISRSVAKAVSEEDDTKFDEFFTEVKSFIEGNLRLQRRLYRDFCKSSTKKLLDKSLQEEEATRVVDRMIKLYKDHEKILICDPFSKFAAQNILTREAPLEPLTKFLSLMKSRGVSLKRETSSKIVSYYFQNPDKPVGQDFFDLLFAVVDPESSARTIEKFTKTPIDVSKLMQFLKRLSEKTRKRLAWKLKFPLDYLENFMSLENPQDLVYLRGIRLDQQLNKDDENTPWKLVIAGECFDFYVNYRLPPSLADPFTPLDEIARRACATCKEEVLKQCFQESLKNYGTELKGLFFKYIHARLPDLADTSLGKGLRQFSRLKYNERENLFSLMLTSPNIHTKYKVKLEALAKSQKDVAVFLEAINFYKESKIFDHATPLEVEDLYLIDVFFYKERLLNLKFLYPREILRFTHLYQAFKADIDRFTREKQQEKLADTAYLPHSFLNSPLYAHQPFILIPNKRMEVVKIMLEELSAAFSDIAILRRAIEFTELNPEADDFKELSE